MNYLSKNKFLRLSFALVFFAALSACGSLKESSKSVGGGGGGGSGNTPGPSVPVPRNVDSGYQSSGSSKIKLQARIGNWTNASAVNGKTVVMKPYDQSLRR